MTYRNAISLLFIGCLVAPTAFAQSPKDDRFADDPAARRVFESMHATIRDAESLSYASSIERHVVGGDAKECRYRVWLKKPNFYRMEVETVDGRPEGVMIGDGKVMWIYWRNGRPRWENVSESEQSEKTRHSSYMSKMSPAGRISILHEAVFLASEMTFPILEMSLFHGYKDSMVKEVDAVRFLPQEEVDGELCDVIEVAFLDYQRKITIAVSQRDHLPRRVGEIAHLSFDVVGNERWTDVKLDGEISNERFQWEPPSDWEAWQLPDEDDALIAAGKAAHDFDLASLDGKRIRLSDYRDQVVWISFWRVGCTACRVETPFLQKLHANYGDRGLVILGVNVSDDRKMTEDFLNKHGVTYRNVLDTSAEGERVYYDLYGVGSIPVNYIVDREGKVVDGWIGHSEERAAKALLQAGIDISALSD